MDNLNQIYEDLKTACPTAWAEFMTFVDKYKGEVAWPFLFAPEDLKFHDIPVDMQCGVLMRFIDVMRNDMTKEQHHQMLEDLIRTQFSKIEEKISKSELKRPLKGRK